MPKRESSHDPSILALAAIVALAAWPYRSVAPGAGKIPMQWSFRGKVNWSARRLMAFGFVPALDAAILILLIASGMAGGNELAFTGCLLFGCQIVHIALVRRRFAARQA